MVPFSFDSFLFFFFFFEAPAIERSRKPLSARYNRYLYPRTHGQRDKTNANYVYIHICLLIRAQGFILCIYTYSLYYTHPCRENWIGIKSISRTRSKSSPMPHSHEIYTSSNIIHCKFICDLVTMQQLFIMR